MVDRKTRLSDKTRLVDFERDKSKVIRSGSGSEKSRDMRVLGMNGALLEDIEQIVPDTN